MRSEITIFIIVYDSITTDRIDGRESTLIITLRTDTIKITKITLFTDVRIDYTVTTIFIASYYLTFKRAETIGSILVTMITLFTII